MSQPGSSCPKCGTDVPCVDYCEVDIGVGVQTWNHEYQCPAHGPFAFTYNETTHRSEPIFRDEP